MKKSRRIFLAARPPGKVIDKLNRSIVLYRKELWGKDVRWVKPENLHLTLKFIGTVENDCIDDVIRALKLTLNEYSSFPVVSTGIKIFPKPSRPGIISAGIASQPLLEKLVSEIENSLFRLGIQKEKRDFKGHITLGRCKKTFPKRQKIETVFEAFSFQIDQVVVYRSLLRPEGPEYRVEEKISFF